MELYILRTDSSNCLYQKVSKYLANPSSRLVEKLASLGICVRSFYQTEGQSNLIMLMEAPSDEAAQQSYHYMYSMTAKFNPQFKRFSKHSL